MVVKRRSFAKARKAAGYTQEGLAEHLSVDRTTVARWEGGRAEPKPWQRPKIADAFGLSLRECNQLLDDVGTTGHTVDVSAALVKAEGALPGGAYAAAQTLRGTSPLHPMSAEDISGLGGSTGQELIAALALPAGIELVEGFATPLDCLTFLSSAARVVAGEQRDRIYDQLTKLLRQWAGIMNRRELFQLFGWAATTIAAGPAIRGLDEGEQERLAGPIALPSRVDTRVVDHLATILRDCKQRDDVLGPRAVLHMVLTYRQLARHLLAECPAPLRPRLLAVYSSMSSSVGDYFFDLNDLDNSRYYYDQARAAAHEARNTELGIYALCSMSYAASSQGKAHAGIDFAAAAQSLADKSDDALLRVCAAERAGTAYAVDGQYKPFMAEFDRARNDLVSVGDVSTESPAYYYHEGLLASHQSECLLLLKQPDEAAACASTGLAVFNKSYVDGYALCALHLGNSYLQTGEVEEAVQVIGSAASLAAQNRQARLVTELYTTRARMQPWEGTQAVKDLDEWLVGAGFGV
jgi:DNA-binding XRE family transcriptional regulator/tetratricopeptide (TPR) repeat protein